MGQRSGFGPRTNYELFININIININYCLYTSPNTKNVTDITLGQDGN